MALTTYAELKASIADWLVRDDLTTVVDDFVDMAEADMNRHLKHWRMEGRVTLSVSGQYTDLPTDFVAFRKVTLSDTVPRRMELMSRATMQEEREAASDTTGAPEYYALTDGDLEVFPSPDDTYSVDLAYVEKVPALSDSNTTNWVLDNHPDLYLAGSMIYASAYEKDDQAEAKWQARFNGLLESINRESDRARFSGAGLRTKINSY